MGDLLIAPFRNGHAREEQNISATCETFSRNMRDLCNFLGPFPPMILRKFLTFQFGKLEKDILATNFHHIEFPQFVFDIHRHS